MLIWLTTALGTLALGTSALLMVPSVVVFTQVMTSRRLGDGTFPGDRVVGDASVAGRPSVAVLIPAHNEEQGIEATLATVLPQMKAEDRVLVVADNCSDATARVARAMGAQVVERHHASLRGKGYALDHGIRHLADHPPDVVVIVDADCRVDDGSIDALARATQQHQRPTQALYLMHAPVEASPRQRLAAFAWLLRNQVRPLGALAIDWPCQLMGSGMGFVFSHLKQAPVATGNIVEDMQLGMDFAAEGRAPLFVPTARVHSEFPSGEQASQQQRTRWEHGHLATITSAWRQWGLQALKGRTIRLLPMLLDLSVPPLALTVMLQVGALLVTVVAAALGLLGGLGGMAAGLLALSLLLTTGSVLQAWRLAGRHLLQGRELLSMPVYALRKIPLYLGYLVKKQTAWVRTERDVKTGKS